MKCIYLPFRQGLSRFSLRRNWRIMIMLSYSWRPLANRNQEYLIPMH